VLFAQGSFRKDLWIDWKKISAGNQKRSLRLIKGTERSLRSGGCAETLSRQRWRLQPVLSSVGFRGFCPSRKGEKFITPQRGCDKLVSEHGYNTWPAWAHERVAQKLRSEHS
jgi:hypothetical protein